MVVRKESENRKKVRVPSSPWMAPSLPLNTLPNTNKSGLFPSNYVRIMDKITNMADSKNRHFGRPDWKSLFSNVRAQVEAAEPRNWRPQVGTFFCGPSVLSKQLYMLCVAESKLGRPLFTYHKENF